MANDAPSKPTKISNSPEGTTVSSATDQQKVPPLRIVLNTSTNQKSTTTTATVSSQQTTNNSTRKERSAQDVKSDGTVKVGGRVRIKLGTNKQPTGRQNNNTSDTRQTIDGNNHKNKSNTTTGDKIVENLNEDTASSFGHLRRITRRSQRAVQSLNNEDEESISSMTSIDENQNSNNNQLSGDIVTQDSEQSNSASASNSANTAASNATNGSNVETPRRYKRRKVESSESQIIEYENLLASQNYKLPNQNSFELFKNIRKQVDKKLKNLNNVHPRAPYGFRDYMLTRGSYLLDGNKLGNGTYLFMNEDGGLNPAPLGKYHLLKKDRTNYSVPNRAKVPLGLPINSPLHDLFVEQEKERYRMRMQHIKEREKLTLSAEQEIMRVYNQAALTAADQTEPFSVCIMLKHQEIYNYMDSDGVTILSREDARQDQAKPDGVRTRRRQHGHISPSPTNRKSSDADESSSAEAPKKDAENTTSPPNGNHAGDVQDSQKSSETSEDLTTTKDNSANHKDDKEKVTEETDNKNETKPSIKVESIEIDQLEEEKKKSDAASPNDEGAKQGDGNVDTTSSSDKSETLKDLATKSDSSESKTDDKKTVSPVVDGSSKDMQDTKPATTQVDSSTQQQQAPVNEKTTSDGLDEQNSTTGLSGDGVQPSSESGSLSLSSEDKRVQNKDLFLSHLQEIDDKWEGIRHEMLVRHMNEAESLHAIQKLEWEWKTKEIGACDVRTTPVIDDTLVPRLNIYSQDY